MEDKRIVILFIKVPARGEIKSRLSRSLDKSLVLRLYECMVLDTIDMLEHACVPFRICFSPPDALEDAAAWLGREHTYMPQTGGDLGERMEQAFSRVFSEGVEQAILIGSDIPGLTPDVIREALASLDTHDAVLGPANDGGYYLVGFKLKSFYPDIFRNVAWSTAAVFAETRERLRAATLAVHVLPERIDADTQEDLIALLDRNAGQGAFPRTFALLERHRKDIGR